MRYGILISSFLIAFFLPSSVCSQQHLFMNYTVNDGMLANSIRRVIQDSKGFLWIATWEGLSKYDGYTFTNYTTNNGLSHNLVNDVYETGDKLYIACNNGDVDIMENGAIRKKAYTGIIINRFIKDTSGRVIAATDYNGLQEFHAAKFSKPAQSFPNGDYYGLETLNDSLLAAITPSAIQVLDRNYELVSSIDPADAALSYCIFRDSKRRVWVGTAKGLRLLSPAQGRGKKLKLAALPALFDHEFLTKAPVHDIFEDEQGTLWFATETGLIMVTSGGAVELFDNHNGLPSSNITSLMQDREGNIWIGTSLGLSKLITRNRILTYKTANGLHSDYLVFLLPLDSSRLLVAGKGLQVFDHNRKVFKPTSEKTNQYEGFVTGAPAPLLIKDNQVWSMDAMLQPLKNIMLRPAPYGISAASCDKQGNLFIANDRHLLMYTKNGHLLDSLSLPFLNNLLPATDDKIWAGTRNDGIYCIRYFFNGDKVIFDTTDHFIKGRSIRHLFADRSGNIWAGTRYDGAYRFHRGSDQTYSISQFDQSTGLTSNWIRAITQTGDGSIWLGFYQGLDKLIPDNDHYRVFNFSRVNNFYASINNIISVGDHELWLATVQGMTHITDGVLERSAAKPVYITKIVSADSTFVPGRNPLTLDHTRNHLQFWFTSPAFINEKQIMYSYRLAGGTGEWSTPSNLHTVSYANLGPGNYTFEVRSLGWNGAWGQPAQFNFRISAPFWQRPLFIAGLVLLLGSVIAWMVRRRVKAIRQRAELKHHITEKEMIALRAQMNPHFIFNSLNSIDNLIQNNEKDKATIYLARFAKLIRAILENSKQEVIPVWKDLETLQLYLDLELLRCDNKFTYTANIDPELLQGDYKIPPLIIQPFVENAIHHGLLNKKENDRHLQITGSVEHGHIRLTIEDNGVGTEQAQMFKQLNKPAHQSLGHMITRERIELHNGKVIADPLLITELRKNNQPAGTRVTILLVNK